MTLWTLHSFHHTVDFVLLTLIYLCYQPSLLTFTYALMLNYEYIFMPLCSNDLTAPEWLPEIACTAFLQDMCSVISLFFFFWLSQTYSAPQKKIDPAIIQLFYLSLWLGTILTLETSSAQIDTLFPLPHNFFPLALLRRGRLTPQTLCIFHHLGLLILAWSRSVSVNPKAILTAIHT
jgi:hypothetical protein